MPKFTVVIPTYNRAQKVLRAVRSVLAQTNADYEVSVIDDGSTDETAALLSALPGPINYVFQPNAGVAAARNQGIVRAHGDYIAFLDADDWFYPGKLSCMATAIQARPDVGLFYSAVDYVDENGRKIRQLQCHRPGRDAYLQLLHGDFIATSAAVVKKDCFDRLGGFDGRLSPCEDWDMWLRIACAFPLCCVPRPYVAYECLSVDNLTSDHDRWIKAHDEVIEKAFRTGPMLTPMVQRRIRSRLAYTKGRIYLGAREEKQALAQFSQALALDPGNWRALVFQGAISSPWLRRQMPARVKRALRFPEALIQ